ncbi:MAG: NAD(P)H-hydrate epimerase [Planctomycetota bacterium]
MRVIDPESSRALDAEAVEKYRIPSIVLMENAARSAAEVAIELHRGSPGGVLIACGPGNNGGDGFALARHLHNHGIDVRLVLASDPSRFAGDALTNLRVCESMGFSIERLSPAAALFEGVGLVVDALLGTGVSGPLRPGIAEWIRQINRSGTRVLCLDVPTGLDPMIGDAGNQESVRAHTTVSFVAPKPGMLTGVGRTVSGRIVVGDIGVPMSLIERWTRTVD